MDLFLSMLVNGLIQSEFKGIAHQGKMKTLKSE